MTKALKNFKVATKSLLNYFLNEVSRLSKQGLYGEYNENTHNTKYIKGKIQIQDSIRLVKPNLICQYDEFLKIIF